MKTVKINLHLCVIPIYIFFLGLWVHINLISVLRTMFLEPLAINTFLLWRARFENLSYFILIWKFDSVTSSFKLSNATSMSLYYCFLKLSASVCYYFTILYGENFFLLIVLLWTRREGWILHSTFRWVTFILSGITDSTSTRFMCFYSCSNLRYRKTNYNYLCQSWFSIKLAKY